MAHVYGQDWYKLLKKCGGQEPGPVPFQGRALVPVGTLSDPSGAPPAASAVAVASSEEVRAPAAGPESYELGSHQSDDAFSQGSWAEKPTAEIRQMLRDFDPELDTPQEYEAFSRTSCGDPGSTRGAIGPKDHRSFCDSGVVPE